MDKDKFNVFLEYVEQSFIKVAKEITDIDFTLSDTNKCIEPNTVNVVMGITGNNKGRIIIQSGEEMSSKIAELVNTEPLKDKMELYLCMSEFSNIFCGNAVTLINNRFKGTGLRLSPPAVFEGEEIEITTPSIRSTRITFTSSEGQVIMDIGFEGV